MISASLRRINSFLDVCNASVLYSLSDVFLKFISLVLIPFYTSVLSPSDYGVVGVCTSLSQMLGPWTSFGVMGAFSSLYFSVSPSQREEFTVTVTNFLVCCGLLVFIFSLCGQSFFGDLIKDVPFNPFIVLAIAGCILGNFQLMSGNIFNIQQRAKRYLLLSLFLGFFGILSNFYLIIVMRMGALGTLLSSVFVGMLSVIILFKIIQPIYRLRINFQLLKMALAFSLPSLPHLVSSSIWKFADRLFLVKQATLADTGHYSLAMTLSSTMLIVIGGLTTAMNPVFFKTAYEKGSHEVEEYWSNCFNVVFVISLLLTAAISLFGREILLVLTPNKYHKAADYVTILAVSQLFFGLSWVLSPVIGFTKKTWIYPAVTFPITFLSLVSNSYLIPLFGASGAAMSQLITTFAQFCLMAILCQRCFRLKINLKKLHQVMLSGLFLVFISTVKPDNSYFLWFTIKLSLFIMVVYLAYRRGLMNINLIEGKG